MAYWIENLTWPLDHFLFLILRKRDEKKEAL